MVPYVDEVVSVTVICVLLFVVYVCMLRECEGATDVSVVRGMRGVGEVCEMCMCLARDGVGGEGVSV